MINCLSLELKSNHEFVFGPFSVSFWYQEELFFVVFLTRNMSVHTNLSLGIIPQSSTEDRYPDTLICYRVLWMSELVD